MTRILFDHYFFEWHEFHEFYELHEFYEFYFPTNYTNDPNFI